MNSSTITVTSTPSGDIFIGLFLAVSSCFFIGASFIIKKKSLLRLNVDGNIRASDGGFGYLKDWLWWAGVLTMGVGEGANFIAYAFAPASLVTPMGALSILVATLLAAKFLDEHLNLIGKMGCLLVILGSTIVVLHAPKEGDVNSMLDLILKFSESGFFYYIMLVILVTILAARFAVPRWGHTNVTVHVFICSVVGSLSVMLCKGIGLIVREWVSGSIGESYSGLFIIFVLILIVCISVQMVYLNKALDIFPTAIVKPVYYVFFTSSVMIASAILFQEWHHMTATNVIGMVSGFLVVIVALFMMNGFRDIRISLMDLYPIKSSKRLQTSL